MLENTSTEDILNKANMFIKQMEDTILNPNQIGENEELKVGVDLGTSNIVITVLDKNNVPVAGEVYPASVVKDGIVVEYLKAVTIVRELKGKLEKTLNRTLENAATAIPPGISKGNVKVIQNVVEAADFSVTNVIDEPTAASEVLQIQDGAVVDVGGGTTGISILKNGKVVYSADEPTGGHHLSLVVSGSLGIEYEEAEKFKVDPDNYNTVFPLVRPVIEKMADIVLRHVQGYDVETIYLVGGTCCLKDIEQVFQKYTGIKTIKPYNPLLVTPIGIAMNSVR
ncbi:ethanolamine utilization protein EutJ [Clostridium magnum]|uniref:Chaperone protein DnaK n=1 Tax=Clostridium magnum DSM 2767 TaxID=1121326 RepID=A0A162S1R6_9CLOT|nr:ethanolamine utilization protein EutJ [Clostridium magnum]KZL90667.1 chaperone protein DnaK [Clostridium magnum DSM 2767]SHI39276.1 ethanolamine utilization protein EutJ [Clostridium magnum DSM 2767]